MNHQYFFFQSMKYPGTFKVVVKQLVPDANGGYRDVSFISFLTRGTLNRILDLSKKWHIIFYSFAYDISLVFSLGSARSIQEQV